MPENSYVVRGGRGNTPLLHFNDYTISNAQLVSAETGELIANTNISNTSISEDVLRGQTFYSTQNGITGVITNSELYAAADRLSQTEKFYIQRFDYIPPKFIFHPAIENPTQLYLGVELEIDVGGRNEKIARQVIDNLGEDNVYCKADSSVQQGFEIVTHPCTFTYHQTLQYERVFEELIKQGYRSHDVTTCGLHVHFNRTFFGEDKLTQDLNVSKLLYIFEKYWPQIIMIARRDSNTYAKRFFIGANESPLDIYVKAKNTNKYGVINLQHPDTIEIRIFKGTLKYNSFISTLEFVNTLIPIIRNTDIYEIQKLNWEGISSHFSNNLKTYIKEREALKEDLSSPKSLDPRDPFQISGGIIDQYRGLRVTAISETDLHSDNIRTGVGISDTMVDNSSSNRDTITQEQLDSLVDSVSVVPYSGVATRVFNEFSSSSWTVATSSAAANAIESPLSEIDQLQQERRELELTLERTRNPLRKIQIKREISQVTSKIGRLRAVS